MKDFCHLHVHTEYSLLDGACRIEQLVDVAASLGQKAVAITDHGVMFGAVDFYKAAKKRGIKPIIGCEVYVAARTRHDRVHELDGSSYHLVLLCKNMQGYQNLISLVSKAWTEGFYTKPRVDHELLAKYSEGLVCLSACLAGEIPRHLNRGDYERAKETALFYEKTFGHGNYYLEMQDHGIGQQQEILPLLGRLSKETGIPLVATNDSHYLTKEDSKIQNVLLCIQLNKTVDEGSGIEFPTKEFYIKSGDQMMDLFSQYPEAVENTVKIADMCDFDFEFGNTQLPHFDVPEGKTHDEYFREMCFAGLHNRYGSDVPSEITERLEYELGTIGSMGYIDYFLIVYDFIRYAKENDIPVGPGRGSGAGSLAAYCLGITSIDPIRYQLLFERFLNPERISMPDFDIDFCYERRQKVIDYVVEKYGADHVAQIITFGTMAARAAIRDVGRALGIAYATVDTVAKLVPMELHMTLERALKTSADLKAQYDRDPQIRELLDTAMKLEGMPRHASTHAAGVVITHRPVSHYVPLQKNDESIVTQYPMTTLEELGLLKMDFLGLRNLTVLRDASEMIRKMQPDFALESIPIDDRPVFDMLSQGLTDGVFQFESAGMRQVLMNLGPESMEDLIAVISLYRPGPMESIPKYIENRHNPGKVTYRHPLLSDILDVTYGCMVYQEQVMQVFRELAGYSYGRADIVRRAMSKKKHDVMEQERRHFIYGLINEDGSVECEGAVKRGVNAETANAIFDEMASFASYAFNKSHAAAYAMVSYQTAYMKCHYPREYMAALLTSVLDSSGKVSDYIGECSRLKIGVLPPSVNESREGFTVVDQNIRFGLLAVKNLGRGFIRQILIDREQNGEFTGFYDFCKRMFGSDINRRAIESLIKCGALDGLGLNRRQMLSMNETMLDTLNAVHKRNVEGQIGMFDQAEVVDEGPTPPSVGEVSLKELLAMEKEVTGIYLSGHPMAEYAAVAARKGCTNIGAVIEECHEVNGQYKEGSKVALLAIVVSVRLKTTKSNSTMAFVGLEDRSGAISMLVFPKTLADFGYMLKEGAILFLKGRVSVKEDEDASFICESIELSPGPNDQTVEDGTSDSLSGGSPPSKPPAKSGLYLTFPSRESDAFNRAMKILAVFDGLLPVFVKFMDTGRKMIAPREKWIMANVPMIKELKNILGEKNVMLIE